MAAAVSQYTIASEGARYASRARRRIWLLAPGQPPAAVKGTQNAERIVKAGGWRLRATCPAAASDATAPDAQPPAP